MPGERDLATLLRTLEPVLHPGEAVFVTVAAVPAGLTPRLVLREAEGTTLVLERAEADRHGLPFAFPCVQITLTVHSALDAVGLLAAVTHRLATAGIPVNVVSGYFHDHLFVPPDRADEALLLLHSLAAPPDA